MLVNKPSYFSFNCGNYIPENAVINAAVRRDGYYQRLCSEISDTYKLGGTCLMLLLTYNNKSLPFTYNPLYNEYAPTFNRKHLQIFLNRLKVYSRRRQLGSYKYFICMEYGSNTKRQHYHLLLFCHNKSKYRNFIDLIREIWDKSLDYGFVFPDAKMGSYEKALLRSRHAAASYVSKYVTKDVAYLGHPKVVRLRKYYEHLKAEHEYDEALEVLRCFPRILQSNGIGQSLENQLITDFSETLYKGILNPLTKRYAPIPQYIINKYMYSNVLAFDGRKGLKDNVLYDRILKVDDEKFIQYKLVSLDNLTLKYYNVIASNFVNNSEFMYISKCFTLNNDIYKLASILAKYRQYVRIFSSNVRDFVKDFYSAFDIENIKKYISFQSDTYSRYLEFSKRCKYSSYINTLSFEFIDLSNKMKNCIKQLDTLIEMDQEERILKENENYEIKKRNAVKCYPVNLC